MPLPDNGTDLDWPPRHMAAVNAGMAEWSAWYSGDPDELRATYGDRSGATAIPGRLGVVGTVRRWFWGSPAAPGQAPVKLHVPVASDIATASADLLFAQQVGIEWADQATQDRMDQVLQANRWASLLPEAAEVCSALSHVFLRCTWDTTIDPDHPIISAVHPDQAVPVFAYGRLQSVVFWRAVHTEGHRVWRHLESHDPGRITHGLYEGDKRKLGRLVPLTDQPSTAAITVDAQAGVSTGWPGLSAVWVPNMAPSRRWRRDALGSQVGRSDLEGVEPLLDAVDETLTSWMRDVRLGKSRIVVPNYMLQDNGQGQAATFNIDREVFVGLAMPPVGDATASITAQQFLIRTQEHADTMRGLLGHVFRSAGYSAQTFGLADDTSTTQTATEVHSRDQRSEVTREKKTRYWTDAMRAFLIAVAAIDRAQFRGPGAVEPPKVEFPASSQPSEQEVAASVQQLRAAEVMSTDTGVRLVHPDWDDEAVAEEVAKIAAERDAAVPSLGPLPSDPEQPSRDGDVPDALA